MCLRRAPEKHIAGSALDRAGLDAEKTSLNLSQIFYSNDWVVVPSGHVLSLPSLPTEEYVLSLVYRWPVIPFYHVVSHVLEKKTSSDAGGDMRAVFAYYRSAK
jgi:hypothetical protein